MNGRCKLCARPLPSRAAPVPLACWPCWFRYWEYECSFCGVRFLSKRPRYHQNGDSCRCPECKDMVNWGRGIAPVRCWLQVRMSDAYLYRDEDGEGGRSVALRALEDAPAIFDGPWPEVH